MQPIHGDERALTIDVVIVNWNSGSHLARCVSALQHANHVRSQLGRVIIVDNASSDGSCSVEVQQGLHVDIIRNVQNLGFAAGCNQGAASCRAPVLLFLNPDVELEPGTLTGLGQRLLHEIESEIAIIGVGLVDAQGRVQRSCARFPTAARMVAQALALDRLAPWLVRPHFMTEWGHCDTRVVDQVIGACMLMRRADFERLGGFDERFFLYMEDVDLAARASAAGLKSLYVHDRRARHVGGGSTEGIPDIRLAYLMRSRILYARKHFDALSTLVVTLATLIIEPAARLLSALWRWRLNDAKAALAGAQLCWQRYPFRRNEELGEIKPKR